MHCEQASHVRYVVYLRHIDARSVARSHTAASRIRLDFMILVLVWTHPLATHAHMRSHGTGHMVTVKYVKECLSAQRLTHARLPFSVSFDLHVILYDPTENSVVTEGVLFPEYELVIDPEPQPKQVDESV